MAPVRAVGFDYTGVVATLPTGDFFDEMADKAGVSRERVLKAYLGYRRDFQVGRMTQHQVWRQIADDLGAGSKFDQLWQTAISRMPAADVEVLRLVDTLRGRQIKVGLLSNLAVPTPWSKDLHDSGTAAHFDKVLLSGETGYVKPEPQAFQLLAAQLEVRPDELVFVDDRNEALAGVEKQGIRPILYRDVLQLRRELQQLDLPVD